MKQIIYLTIAILIGIAFASCEKEDTEEVVTTKNVKHHFYQLGFPDIASALSVEFSWGAAVPNTEKISMTLDLCSYDDAVEIEIPDYCQLIHSYSTSRYVPIYGGGYYDYTYYYYYAYYSIIVEWDHYDEVSTLGNLIKKRVIRKNTKCTVQYLGCTIGTPAEYIPTNTAPEVTTYPDFEGEWITISEEDEDDGGWRKRR